MHFCRELNTRADARRQHGDRHHSGCRQPCRILQRAGWHVYSDLRACHGHAEPYGVKYWCVGNEMDGPWQIGHLPADEYGRKALEAAKMMRMHDPSIETVLCGSSHARMPTYPDWDRTTLEIAWEQVNYHSMHYYATNYNDDTASLSGAQRRLRELRGYADGCPALR